MALPPEPALGSCCFSLNMLFMASRGRLATLQFLNETQHEGLQLLNHHYSPVPHQACPGDLGQGVNSAMSGQMPSALLLLMPDVV